MECRGEHFQQKEKDKATSNMGNLCCKDIPNINLSCINNDMVSSCCKNSVDKIETATLYKWIYYIPDKELKNDANAWYETFDQCKDDALCNIHMYHPETHNAIHLYIYRWIVGTPPMLFYKRQLMTSQRKLNKTVLQWILRDSHDEYVGENTASISTSTCHKYKETSLSINQDYE